MGFTEKSKDDLKEKNSNVYIKEKLPNLKNNRIIPKIIKFDQVVLIDGRTVLTAGDSTVKYIEFLKDFSAYLIVTKQGNEILVPSNNILFIIPQGGNNESVD